MTEYYATCGISIVVSLGLKVNKESTQGRLLGLSKRLHLLIRCPNYSGASCCVCLN